MQKYDCIIIGTGIAGQLVANKLIDTGLKICILESGSEHRNASLEFLNEFKSTGVNFRADFFNRIRQLGGASNLWAGRMMRLLPEDIESRPWLGLNSWPIEYEELERYYNHVDEMFGIVNSWNYAHDIPFQYNLDPNVVTNARSVWAKSTPRFNEGSDSWKSIKNCKNIDIFLDCTVINLECKSNHEVTVNCVHDGRKSSVTANCVVIACGGIENARILLDSKDNSGKSFECSNINIGRYFMDHPTYVSQPIPLVNSFPISTLSQKTYKNATIKDGLKYSKRSQTELAVTNPYIEISMHMGEKAEKAMASIVALYKSKAVNKCFSISPADMLHAINTLYLMNPIEKFPHVMRQSYDYMFRKFRNNMIGQGIVFSHHIENLPSFDSYIKKVDKKNIFGCSEIQINWKVDNQEIESSERLMYEFIKYLKVSRLINNDIKIPAININQINDASHHMGTTRMSASSINGVVDKNLKFWGAHSIYVAGSSVFPSSGHANPTYTIAALSLRLGEYLKKNLKTAC